ncbi:ABC-three component system middle component 1 [Bacillus thuringiensis]|uniref:ABC-three component system middle component 1 n=1 Tax=Bacillus thuringiensis TaxID=1428 RepID=UPI001F5B9A00|nr:ABC-three component system middle component 1 [Bacillus thuringiensis]
MVNFDNLEKSDVVVELQEKNKTFKKYNVKSWVKSQLEYNINIFTVVLKENMELELFWEELTNSIAFHFQSELEKNIEIWNVYVVFFVEAAVDKELKYEIEQDKYSSRKIVYDCFETHNKDVDFEIKCVLDNKLFGFQLQQVETQNKDTIHLRSVEDVVKEMDMKLYQIIKYSQKNSNVKSGKLLDLYKGKI